MKDKTILYKGRFLATSRKFGFVEVEELEGDIFIPSKYCKNVFDGDQVIIELIKPGKKRKKGNVTESRRAEGKIVKVVERSVHTVVGMFTRVKRINFLLPDNDKINTDIYIPKGATLGAVNGQKVVVEITDYGNDKKSPEGQVIQILGFRDAPGVDILSVVKSYGIEDEFQDKVWHEIKDLPSQINGDEYSDRKDIRNIDTVTIDGEDAKDLDDAITIEKNEDGSFNLGVHIADVSHYVKENSLLDQTALNRGTSVYLADRVIPMLPRQLSNGICSLNEGCDRLALSCFMKFDKDGKQLSHSIEETVINVNRRMNYTDVDDILKKNNDETIDKYKEFLQMFENMEELASILNKKRKKQGSINFNFGECKIKLDKYGKPIDIIPRKRNIATSIIEEFMLAANQTVAEEYFWLQIPFLYRIHEQPDKEKILELSRIAIGLGYHIKVGNEQIHPREMQKFITSLENTDEEAFLSRLSLRTMKRAKYSTNNEGHFGLAMKYYTHFTSPIRRYPDLQIHRIIKENIHSSIRGKRLEHYENILGDVAQKTSIYERRAEDAEREVEKMKKVEYMENYIGETFEGIISGMTSWGIYVELENTIEGMIRISDMNEDRYEFDEEKYQVRGHFTGKIYRMGQSVEVKCIAASKDTRTIDFILAQDDI